MASPFKIFRDNQQVLMVVLVIMAMFAFTLDSLFSAGGTNLILLGLLLGAGLSLIAGLSAGRPLEYALAGTIVGGLLGYLMPMITGSDVVLTTEFGNVTQEKLDDMVGRRQVANQFIQQAWRKSNGNLQYDGSRQYLFGFGHQSLGHDVLLGEALRREADGLGVTVDDDAINEFINQVTGGKLRVEDFADLRKNLAFAGKRLSETVLYDILRDEIQARLALQMLMPLGGTSIPSPEEYWQLFKRLNVRQELTSVELPVEDFAAGVADPSDVELADFFEEYNGEVPNSREPGSPGFYRGRTLRLAWLEADYLLIEKSIPDITDFEIEQYYEAHKDDQFKEEYLPDPTGDAESAGTGESSDEGDGDTADTTEPPANTEVPPTPKEPAADKPAEQDTQPDAEGTPPNPGSDDADSDDAQASTGAAGMAVGFVRHASEGISPPNVVAAGTVPEPGAALFRVDDPGTPENGRSDDEPSGDGGDAESNPANDVPPKSGPGPDDESYAGPGPRLPGLSGTTETGGADATPPAEPPTRYEPLDDALRGRIRDMLLAERTGQEMEERIIAAIGEMRRLADGFYAPPDTDNPDARQLTTEEMSERLRSFADENGLKYVETALLSYAELSDPKKHPIGSAMEPGANRFMQPNAQTVADELFRSTSAAILFEPDQAIDLFATENRFAFWVTQEREPHVPTLDEAGVRERVVAAWKLQKARPLANERAGELKGLGDRALTDGETFSDAFEELTITGDEGSRPPAVLTTPRFSWMRRRPPSTAPPTDLASLSRPPELSPVIGVELAGNDFMRTVFEVLDDGETGVVANADRSKLYLVQVRNRKPSTEAELAGMRTRFMNERFLGFGSPYPHLVFAENQQVNSAWTRRLEEKHGIVPRSADP